MISSWNKTIKGSDNEEALLGAIGPSVETLFTEYPLRPGFKRGVSPELAKRLNPPPLPTWVFWTTAGVALGAGVLSGGAALMAREKHESYNDTIRGSEPPSDSISNTVLRAKQEEAEIWDSATLGLLISAGILVVGASLEAIFTDWYGYGESGVDLAVVPAAAPRSMSAVLSW